MNHDERQLLQDLFDRLRDSGNQPRDPEADRFIAEQVRYQPGAPYYMAQAVIVQEQALQQSQERIAELEDRVRQLEAQAQPQQGSGSFLAGRTGGLFSRGAAPQPARPAPPAASVPNTGGSVWNRGPSMAPRPQAGGYSQPMQPAPQPAGGGGGFLKGALATAAGVAGGALIYDQMKGMFGGGSGQAHAGSQPSAADQAAADRALDEQQDAELAADEEQDYDQDMGGSDDIEV